MLVFILQSVGGAGFSLCDHRLFMKVALKVQTITVNVIWVSAGYWSVESEGVDVLPQELNLILAHWFIKIQTSPTETLIDLHT